MTHEELEEAIPLYAIGALERSERQAIEAHLLSGCAACHAALKEYQTVASHLPFGLTPATPPNTLKATIMSAPASLPGTAESEKSVGRSSLEPGEWMTHLFPPITPARSWPLQLAAGFAGLAILGLGYLAWFAYTQSSERSGEIQQLQAAVQQATAQVATLQTDLQQRQQTVGTLKAELNQQSTEAAELRDQLIHREAELEDVRAQLTQRESSLQRLARQNEEFTGFFKNPASKVVSLAGSEMAKSAGAFILFDPVTKKAWLYAFNLPALPNGKVYQLWAIDDKPVSAGVFGLDTGQKGRMLIRNLREFARMKKFAVTVEPDGGVPQPTGAIYLVGQI
ncbi:MAG TPA: anti-sigma factor [Nitrospira sp.]|jgi:anti-sigma-K factor RskA|nr:anti-sigma factor [Nitrospira sp.]